MQAAPPRGKGAAKLAKHEQRRIAKERRAAEWAAFMATKPDESYIDPADEAAIAHAERNMGDLKLKADPDYVPPGGEAITAARKKLEARRWAALLVWMDSACFYFSWSFSLFFLCYLALV